MLILWGGVVPVRLPKWSLSVSIWWFRHCARCADRRSLLLCSTGKACVFLRNCLGIQYPENMLFSTIATTWYWWLRAANICSCSSKLCAHTSMMGSFYSSSLLTYRSRSSSSPSSVYKLLWLYVLLCISQIIIIIIMITPIPPTDIHTHNHNPCLSTSSCTMASYHYILYTYSNCKF